MELYNIREDFSQANNLAQSNPQKLRELQDLWWAEAARYNVLPLDASFAERFDPAIRPSLTRGRNTFTYYGHMTRIPEGTAPDTKNKSLSISADVEISGRDRPRASSPPWAAVSRAGRLKVAVPQWRRSTWGGDYLALAVRAASARNGLDALEHEERRKRQLRPART